MSRRISAEELLSNVLANMLPDNTGWVMIGIPPEEYAPIVTYAGISDLPKFLRMAADMIENNQTEMLMNKLPRGGNA